MANTLSLGSGNWGAKESLLLGYYEDGKKFFPETFDVTRATGGTRVNKSGLIETPTEILSGELVTNGSFDSNINFWTKGGGNANPLSWDNGKMKVTNDVAQLNSARQTITTEIGKTYKVSADVDSTNGLTPRLASTNPTTASIGTSGTIETLTYTFISTSTTTQIELYNWQSTINQYSLWDNVSVVEYNDNNLARIDYLDDAKGALLTEPQSTNLLPYSEDFSQWSDVNGITVASTTETSAPNGLLSSAYKITAFDVASRIQVSSITSASNYTKSIFVKHSTDTVLRFDGSGSNNRVEFSITSSGVTLSSAASNVISTNIEDYGNGWFRISATLPAASDLFQINPDVSGNNNGSVYIWGAQLEGANALGYNGEYSTSYIPTDGSTVTRNKDEVTNGGNVNSFSSEEGVLYAEIATLSDSVNGKYISIGDGSLSNYVYLRITGSLNQIKMGVIKGGSTQASKEFVVSDLTQFNKLAVRYSQDLFKFYVNGALIFTDTNGDIFPVGTLNTLTFNIGNSNNYFFGKTKNVQVFNTALSNSDLLSLTTTGSLPYWTQYSAMATTLNYTNK